MHPMIDKAQTLACSTGWLGICKAYVACHEALQRAEEELRTERENRKMAAQANTDYARATADLIPGYDPAFSLHDNLRRIFAKR